MVEFNPEVQKSTNTDTPAVHFPFMSKEISNLTPDRSKEMLYKGVGQALETGVQLGDKVYDQVVSNDTRQTIDPIEKDYQDRLTKTYNELSGEKTQPGIMDASNKESLPDDLRKFPGRMAKLDAARANGHFSESEHYQRLVDEVTRLRSKYPGKRDQIDSEVSKITGVHPANQLIRARLGDINSYMDAYKEAKNKMGTEAMRALREGEIETPDYLAWQRQDGTFTDADLLKAINKAGMDKRAHQQRMFKHEEGTWSAADEEKSATTSASTYGYQKLDDALNTIMRSTGLGPEKLTEYMEGINSGKYERPTGPQAEEFATKMNMGKQAFLSSLRRFYTTTRPGEKKPDSERMQGKMEDVLKKIGDEWDGWTQAIKKGDFDVATLAHRKIQAMTAESGMVLLNDPKNGKTFAEELARKQLMGEPGYAQWMTRNKDAWNAITDDKQRGEISKNFEDLVSKPSLFKKQIEVAQAKGIGGPEGSKFYDQMIKFVPAMLGKDIDNKTKEFVVKNVMGIDNEGVISKFNRDTVNAKGQEVPGQHHVFDTILSKQNIDHIWKLAKDTSNADIYMNTQMFAEKEFSNLMRDDLFDLNNYKEEFSGIEMGYDPKTKKFLASPAKDTMQAYYGTAHVPPVLDRMLTRINSSLSNMNHIYEKSGQNTDVYLYRLLTASGMKTDLADKMVSALEAAHRQMKNKEE